MSVQKRILTGSSVLSAAAVMGRLLSLVSAPILTQKLGPGAYGVSALVTTVVSLGSTLAISGIDIGYARFYPLDAERGNAEVERLCWRIALLGGVVAGAAAALVCFFFVGAEVGINGAMCVAVVGPSIVLGAINVMAQMRARLAGRYLRIAVAQVVAAASSVGLAVGLSLYWRQDAWPMLLGALASVALNIVLLGGVPVHALKPGAGMTWERTRPVLVIGLSGALNAPAYWALSSVDRWMLGNYAGVAAVGIYSFVSTIGMMSIMVSTALTQTWFPELSRLYASRGAEAREEIGTTVGRLALLLALAWVAVCAAGGDAVRLLATEKFYAGISCLPLVAAGCFFYGMASLANTGLWVAKKTQYSIYGWIGAVVLNVGLNAALIPQFGLLGAACAQSLAFFLTFLVTFLFAQHYFPLPMDYKKAVIVGTPLVAAGLIMFPPWSATPAISLAMKVPAGIILVVAVLFTMAPQWVRGLTHRMVHRPSSGH